MTNLFLTLPVLAQIRAIEGWLEEDEADLLIAATRSACSLAQGLGAIVEVGSYCGRSTVVLASVAQAFGKATKVYAIDPHDGQVGASDQRVLSLPPTLERFRRNLAQAGVLEAVTEIRDYSWNVSKIQPISLLFIDGLHDYINVARDFRHFEPWLTDGAYIAFHDYAEYYPGVQAFVNELRLDQRIEMLRHVRSMVVLQRKCLAAI